MRYVIAVLLIGGLVGCGKEEAPPAAAPTPAAATQSREPVEPIRIKIRVESGGWIATIVPIGRFPVRSSDEMLREMRSIRANLQQRSVVVEFPVDLHPGKDVPESVIAEIIAVCKRVGFTDVGLATPDRLKNPPRVPEPEQGGGMLNRP